MSKNCFNVLQDIAQAKNAPFGALFISILTTINYIAAAAKTKIQMKPTQGQWVLNLNTYSIFIGPPSCGKTPTIKAAIFEPLSALGGKIKESVKGRMTMAALADALSDYTLGNKVYMVNSEVAETLSRNVENSSKKSNGDISMINQVYTGEDGNSGYTSRKDHNIPNDATLCILGKSFQLAYSFL